MLRNPKQGKTLFSFSLISAITITLLLLIQVGYAFRSIFLFEATEKENGQTVSVQSSEA